MKPMTHAAKVYAFPRRLDTRPASGASLPKLQLPRAVEQALGDASSLPTLPTVVTNMLRLVDNPRTSAKDLERHISTDPALTAKILRLVNSAYYGFPNRIGTVSLAVVILGFDTVRGVALTVSVFNMFEASGAQGGFDVEAFWEHSLGCALAAEVISKIVRYRAKGEAFTAGVLHDVGKIALNHFLRERFNEACRLATSESIHISETEKRVVGTTHAEVGGWLTHVWNLPHHLVESIALHHSPSQAEVDPTLSAIVHLADILCRTRKIGSGGDPTVPTVDACVWPLLRLENFGFEAGDIEGLSSHLDAEVDRLKAFSRIIRGVADDPPGREER